MSNNKQSSIDWLINEHFGGLENCTSDFRKKIKQAKEIHRVEIIESYASGSNDRLRNTINTNYYNETFGGNNDKKQNS